MKTEPEDRAIPPTSSVPPARWDGEEREFLLSMLGQRSLFYWKGPQTERLVRRFREHYPFAEVMPCSSGTAAIHIAVAAAGIAPGDEVIVPPITDMGTVIGILYQQGVPIFADLDPHTYNLTPATVEARITPRTRAIMAVHLAGNPCAVDELAALAERHQLVLIEDCAQAWGATLKGKPVGTFGHFGCYSFNDFKHLSCGDGGVVGSSNPRFAPLLQRYGDKGYDRIGSSRMSEFLAPNYRISEPQSAVAAAQLGRLQVFTGHRAALGSLLTRELEGVCGIVPPRIEEGAFSTYWFYLLRLRRGWALSREALVDALRAEGIEASPGYIPVPLYRYPIFRNHCFFGGRWPVKELGLTSVDYRNVSCPVAEQILQDAVYFRIHPGMDESSARHIARVLQRMSIQYYNGTYADTGSPEDFGLTSPVNSV